MGLGSRWPCPQYHDLGVGVRGSIIYNLLFSTGITRGIPLETSSGEKSENLAIERFSLVSNQGIGPIKHGLQSGRKDGLPDSKASPY
jgi:hypothetical protein